MAPIKDPLLGAIGYATKAGKPSSQEGAGNQIPTKLVSEGPTQAAAVSGIFEKLT